jgi:two-component system response regulator FixJ
MSLNFTSSNEVFIVDDDQAVCDSLAMAFTIEGNPVTVFYEAASFIASARQRRPGCVLLDLHMPVKSGLDILHEIDARSYPAPILMISANGAIPTAVEAIRRGAYDFLEKTSGVETMVARVREVMNGRRIIEARFPLNGTAASLRPFPGHQLLTQREREVLSHIMAADSSKEAAKTLGISQRTVEIHRAHVMQKLGAKNAVDLARIVLTPAPAG